MGQTKSKQIVFVDSDAFIALIKEDDTNHKKAKEVLQRVTGAHEVTFITCNYVFSEVVTVISQRVGHKEAIAFIDAITAPDYYIEVKRVTEEEEKHAIDFFKRQSSKNVSFVDCTNMALMMEHQISDIFSFDGVYKTNGFVLLHS